MAFPSDQGLFIVPSGGPPDSPDACPNVRSGSTAACVAATPLKNANGDMTNNIAIKLSVAQGNGTAGGRYLVTSMWDWGPLASWDGGETWPVGDWNPHGKSSGAISETAIRETRDFNREIYGTNRETSETTIRETRDFNREMYGTDRETSETQSLAEAASDAVTVQLETKHSQTCGHDLSSNFWLPVTALPELGIDPEAVAGCSKDKQGFNNTCGSVTINNGGNLTLSSINHADGQDACGFCNNCSLAFFGLEHGERLAAGLQPGTKVKMVWSPFNGPPAPPLPPTPGPHPPPSGPHYPTGGAPSRFGEGGAAHSLGESNHVIMLHFNNIYTSRDGGQNLTWFCKCSARTPDGGCKGRLSGLPAGAVAHESNLAWTRQAGSRTKPDGTVYTIMTIRNVSKNNERMLDHDVIEEDDDDDEAYEQKKQQLNYTSFGELRDHTSDFGYSQSLGSPPLQYLLKSMDYGYSCSWALLPPQLQGGGKVATVAVDPTDHNALFVANLHCVAISRDEGKTFSECIAAVDDPEGGPKSLTTSLHIKDSKTMILLR
eukprot:SAG31_NODE_1584_length_7827_cov_2.129788_8_plen_546_part_00